MLISTALLLDSIIRNSVCTPAKLPCRRVEVGYENLFTRTKFSLYQFLLLTDGTVDGQIKLGQN
jgi:hypothetical protein